jgi:hypothetical protein
MNLVEPAGNKTSKTSTWSTFFLKYVSILSVGFISLALILKFNKDVTAVAVKVKKRKITNL